MISTDHAAFVLKYPQTQILTAVGFQHFDRQQVFKACLAQLRFDGATK